MKKITLSLLVITISLQASAQVIKQHLVEHFTNTSCSVCAANNGSIHSTINAANYVNHISFHPSSPYITDYFNQQNMQENDDRTNFYGVFGSTPKLVFDGVVTSIANLSPAIGNVDGTEMANFEINANATQNGGQHEVIVTIKKIANDTGTQALLFAGLAEDTVFHTTNNGETEHFNVFRKALTSISGNNILLPTAIGDSVQFTFPVTFNTSWVADRIAALIILQKTNKILINSAYSNKFNQGTTGMKEEIKRELTLYPNPCTSYIKLNLDEDAQAEIIDLWGQVVLKTKWIKGTSLNVRSLSTGMYLLRVYSRNEYCFPLIKE